MNYIDRDKLRSSIKENPDYGDFLTQVKKEVDDYFVNFDDSPDRTSRWAHHYFCEKEGARLLYNDKTPRSHKCSVCGSEYDTELFNGCWLTMYRNQGVTNAWKSAMIYSATAEKKYLKNVVFFAGYYNDHYLDFTLHNKEGLEFDSLEGAAWGVSRIMPQSLNEAIFIMRMINALELVKEDLPDGFLSKLEKGLFNEAFIMFQPQVYQIHNIPTWLDSAIGIMGLFLNNQEMIDFAFKGKLNILKQLNKGVTKDNFWYEGSIHYNFFLLEGVVNLMLFAKLKNYDFSKGEAIVEKMLTSAYQYAFDNHLLPNPNDGWPDVNLKTYSYIYAVATKVLGENSSVGKLLGSILNSRGERGVLPLSKPYYYKNDISLEELLFTPDIRVEQKHILKTGSVNFPSSYCGLIKSENSNIFVKYGHNGPSHAHPDKMSLEVVLGGEILSRDLSNSGYGNPLCNSWHRMTPSHNTVMVNGENHSGYEGGECLEVTETRMKVSAKNVYKGVNYLRDVQLEGKGFSDHFEVDCSQTSTSDYIFHVEGELQSVLKSSPAEIHFDKNGYQHFRDLKKIHVDKDRESLIWKVGNLLVRSDIDMKNTELFIGVSPDNSVKGFRQSVILRQLGKKADFNVHWKIEE